MYVLMLTLAAAPVTVSDSQCALFDGGVRCFDLGDHCVSAPPKETFTEFGQVENGGCGLQPTGRVSCWGQGSFVTPPKDLGVVKQLSVAKPLACALLADDTVRCWGTAYQGSLDVPQGTFSQISTGHSVSCGVRTTGALACWGWLSKDRLKPPAGTSFVSVSVGLQVACAIDRSGAMTCWGDLTSAPEGKFTSVSVGSFRAAALRPDGTAVSFFGGPPRIIGPVGTRFSEIGAGCGRRSDGVLACWRPSDPTTLITDDGLTQHARPDGSCPAPKASAPIAATEKRPWVDAVLAKIRDGTVDIESERDHVKREDLPHLVAAYRSLSTWSQKEHLVLLVMDSQDPVLREVMRDVLAAPECDEYGPCWEAWAVALSFLDGNFDRFSAYYDDRKATLAARKRRRAEAGP